MKFLTFAIVSAATLALSNCEVQGPKAGDSHLNDGTRMNDGKMMSASDRVTLEQAGEDRVSSTTGVKR